MKCREQECTEQATHRLAWPGRGWVEYCAPHADKAAALLRSLGSGTVLEPIPVDLLDADWPKAEERLRELRMAYAEIGTAGVPALRLTLDPLARRLGQGERTRALYDEIMAVEF